VLEVAVNAFVLSCLLAAGPSREIPGPLGVSVGVAEVAVDPGRQAAHMRVALVGRRTPEQHARPEVNLCLAVDRSLAASEAIPRVRAGAAAAFGALGPEDMVSLVAYDEVVEVMVPATRATERASIEAGVRKLVPHGAQSALLAGVVKCRAELLRFAQRSSVNRIVLVSTGAADPGSTSSTELGALGAQLREDGISAVALALQAAQPASILAASTGGTYRAISASDVDRHLRDEVAAAARVVSREVEVRVRCGRGVRPVRFVGRAGEVAGNSARTRFATISAGERQEIVLELDLDPGANASARPLADVEVELRDASGLHSSEQTLSVTAAGPRRSEVMHARGPLRASLRRTEPPAPAVRPHITTPIEIEARYGSADPLGGLDAPKKR
jgi:Ca-activated chloride channel family protein